MTNDFFRSIDEINNVYRVGMGLEPLPEPEPEPDECWECGKSGPGVLLTPNIVGHLECAGCRASARIAAREEFAADERDEEREDD